MTMLPGNVSRAGCFHTKRRRHSSHGGGREERPGNLVRRRFHAREPNGPRLTDVTESGLGFGKTHLSPIMDCLDDEVVSRSAPQNPDAKFVGTMLGDATPAPREDEGPALHSDGGVHYW